MKLEAEIADDLVDFIETQGADFIEYLQLHLREWVFCKTHFSIKQAAKKEAQKPDPDPAKIAKCAIANALLGTDHKKMEAVKVGKK